MGLYLVGCTAATKFEVYKLEPNDNTYQALKDDKITVDMYLSGTEKRKVYVPLIYQKAVEKEPYLVMITVEGDKLGGVEVIESKIRIKTEKEEKYVAIDFKNFKNYRLINETPYFCPEIYKYLDYPWKDIQEVEVIFDFYGIKDGQKTRYQARKIFKPHFESFLTNDAMSV